MQNNRTPRHAPTADLTQPEPELLEYVSRDLFRPDLSVKRRLSTPDIGMSRVNKLRAFEYLPEAIEQEEDGHADVSGEEISELTAAPLAGVGEDGKTVEDDDYAEVRQSEPSKVWLEG